MCFMSVIEMLKEMDEVIKNSSTKDLVKPNPLPNRGLTYSEPYILNIPEDYEKNKT